MIEQPENKLEKECKKITCPVARNCDAVYVTTYCTSNYFEKCSRYKIVRDKIDRYGEFS